MDYETGTGGNGTVITYCTILARGDVMGKEEHDTTMNGFVEGRGTLL